MTFDAHRPKPTAAMAQPRTTARLAPSRSSIGHRPAPGSTKPMKKYRRKMPAFEAESCSEIWAYSLAKKKIGMNAIMAISSTMFSTAKARMRKILTLISGDSVRTSTGTKMPMMARPGDDADPGPGIAPSPRDRLLQAEDAQSDTRRDEDGAPVVDAGLAVLRLGLGDRNEHQRDDGHGDVDPEDRPPGPLGQVAAKERPDGGEPSGDAEEQRQRLPRSRRGNTLTTMASAAGNMSAPPAP